MNIIEKEITTCKYINIKIETIHCLPSDIEFLSPKFKKIISVTCLDIFRSIMSQSQVTATNHGSLNHRIISVRV